MTMWHRIQFSIWLLIIFFLSGVITVTAQDPLDQQPFIQMLFHIPDVPTSHSYMWFEDSKAIELAYPPAKMPKDSEEYWTIPSKADSKSALFPQRVWKEVYLEESVYAPFSELTDARQMPATVGLD